MKSVLIRAGLLACLILLGWSYEEASAEYTWPSKCASYGELKPNQNPSTQHMNCLLTNAALEANIPPEVVKAVAEQENGGWKQFDENGEPIISPDGGIGIMQITNPPDDVKQKLKDDIYFNIQTGVEILSSMYDRGDLPKIKGAERKVIESWYFPVMAYNGTKPVNSPLYKCNEDKYGTKNNKAYQEEVFSKIEKESFLDDTQLGQFPFDVADFTYSCENSEDSENGKNSENIKFETMEYTLTDRMHASAYLFQPGDKVVVTWDNAEFDHVNLRPELGSSPEDFIKLAKNTTLIIEGNFVYDQSTNSENNKFVWYPVKTADQKTGYISSAYIRKKLDEPLVNPVGDTDVSISGKASADAAIQIKNGTTVISSTVAGVSGDFQAEISAQKAGTQLTIFYKDKLNELSPSTTITVTDKAPLAPEVNIVTDQNEVVTGTAEPDSVVQVKKGITTIAIGKTNSTGTFSVTIPIQKAGTKISVRVKDSAGNYSPYKTVTVQDKPSPLAPIVNTVTDEDTVVTGTAETNTIVQVKKGITTIAIGKTNSAGTFSVTIPIQKAGTKISVRIKDSAGNYSPYKTVTVQDKPALLAPIVNTVTDEDTVVTGTAEANTIVQVKKGIGTIAIGKTNSVGTFSVEVPMQKAGTKISVRVKDGAGNYSPYATVTVQDKTASTQ